VGCKENPVIHINYGGGALRLQLTWRRATYYSAAVAAWPAGGGGIQWCWGLVCKDYCTGGWNLQMQIEKNKSELDAFNSVNLFLEPKSK